MSSADHGPKLDTLTVRLTELPDEDPTLFVELWYLEADDDVPFSATRDWQREILGALGTGLDDPPPNVYVHRSVDFDWGASSTSQEIIIDIVPWILGNVAWDALKGLWSSYFTSKDATDPVKADMPSREEAISYAKWVIEAKYGDDLETLSVTAVEERLSHGWSIELQGGTRRYDIDLSMLDGYATATRVRATPVIPGALDK